MPDLLPMSYCWRYASAFTKVASDPSLLSTGIVKHGEQEVEQQEKNRTDAKYPCPTRRAATGGHSRKHERAIAPGHETHQALGRCRPGSSPAPDEPTPTWHPT